MMIIETKRLKIIPLEQHIFEKLLQKFSLMEDALSLNYSGRELNDETHTAMEWLYEEAGKNLGFELFYTNWQIVLTEINASIGSACFKGKPDEDGFIEIGFGIDEKFRNNGYMTEAADAMCRWALMRPEINAVIAESDKNNKASHRVLKKCGFIKMMTDKKDSQLWRFKLCVNKE